MLGKIHILACFARCGLALGLFCVVGIFGWGGGGGAGVGCHRVLCIMLWWGDNFMRVSYFVASGFLLLLLFFYIFFVSGRWGSGCWAITL